MQHYKDAESFIKALNNLKAYTVIVEGKRDKVALEMFGLSNVVAINGRTPIKVVDEIRESGEKDVVILTDFDEKGRKLAAKLMRLLLAYRIHPNSRLRKEIMKFGKTEVENLAAFSEAGINLRGDSHGEISANFDKVRNKSKNKGKGRNRKA